MSAEENTHGDESYIAEQERAAAEEAVDVGGGPVPEGADESERALEEAGGGVAEGFELAEEDLIENATHEADANADPTHRAGEPEGAEPQAEYGEADSEEIEDA